MLTHIYARTHLLKKPTLLSHPVPTTPIVFECLHLNYVELVNDLKAAGTTVTKKTIGNTLRRNGLKYCRTRKVLLLKEARVKGRLKFANEHLNDSKEYWETGCGQMRPKSSSLASTRLAAFGGGRMLNMTPRTPSPPSSMEVET